MWRRDDRPVKQNCGPDTVKRSQSAANEVEKGNMKGWKMIKEECGKENRKNLTRENKYQGHVILTQQTAEPL